MYLSITNESPKWTKPARFWRRALPSAYPDRIAPLQITAGSPTPPSTTVAYGRQSIEEKADSQRYFTPFEEKAVVDSILKMAELGTPVRIKYIPALASHSTRHRPLPDRPLKPPGKNWIKALEKGDPELVARGIRAMDWNRHDKNTCQKIGHWFEVIGRVLEGPAIMRENVYYMDETGVMLSMLGSVKVLIGKADLRAWRVARVKRTMVTEKEANKLAKKRRACGRKPKDSALEVSMPGLVGDVACIGRAGAGRSTRYGKVSSAWSWKSTSCTDVLECHTRGEASNLRLVQRRLCEL